MKKIEVDVFQQVEVMLDESKFTAKFMADFREHFYQFKTLEDHAKHLAQLYARGLCSETSFIEGYGPAKEFGLDFKILATDEEKGNQ